MKQLKNLVLTVLATLAFLVAVGPTGAAAEDKVTFQLDWLYGGKHVAFFVARDKGYFKKNGLDVKIIEGKGSLQAATFVDAGNVDFSYGDFVTAIRVIAKGGKNRAIGVGQVFQGGGYSFFKESGISTPKDLEGKRFGTSAADFGNTLLPAMAAASGFDASKVERRIMKPAVRTPALLEGKIDFMSGTRGSSLPKMAIIAKRNGRDIGTLYFKDMGIETYGHVLQTQASRVEKNPEQVQRFVKAVFDAWGWSLQNPKEAFEIFMKANPHKDREISWAQTLEGLADAQDAATKEHGLGYMQPAMVEKSVGIANKYFGLKPPVDWKKTYTDKFIKGTPLM